MDKQNQDKSHVDNTDSNDSNQKVDTIETEFNKEKEVEKSQTNRKVFGPDFQGNMLF